MTLKGGLDAPVEALDHTTGVERFWWGQTVVDSEFGSKRVELKCFSSRHFAQTKEAISELLKIVRMRSGQAR